MQFLFGFLIFFVISPVYGFNDWYINNQWAINNTGQTIFDQLHENSVAGKKGIDIQVLNIWKQTQGSNNIIVAVIDTGIDFSQPELQSALWKNKTELYGKSGIDDDHNGFIDDIYGINLVRHEEKLPIDRNGHGTHVASIIAANSETDRPGIMGISPKVQLMVIKYLDDQMYALTDQAGLAIRYAVDMGAQIINCSWGSALPSKSLEEAILYAKSKNVLIVAGAGNEAMNLDLYKNQDPNAEGFFPALYRQNYENVIAVAAIDPQGELTGFSNFGKSSVDIAAPGWGIFGWTLKGIQKYQGTSQATPFVSSVAALIKSLHPELTPGEIRKRILENATPLKSLRKKLISGGYLNATASVLNQKPTFDIDDPINWQHQDWRWESTHPYFEKQRINKTLILPQARKIALHFKKLSLYSEDKILITDSKGQKFEIFGNQTDDYTPLFSGPKIHIQFQVKSKQSFWGFYFDQVAFK